MFDKFLEKFKKPSNFASEHDAKNKQWIADRVKSILENDAGVIFVSRLQQEVQPNGTVRNTIFHDAYYGKNFSKDDYKECVDKYDEMVDGKLEVKETQTKVINLPATRKVEAEEKKSE